MIQGFTLFGAYFSFYDIFFVLGDICLFIYLLTICDKYEIGRWKTFVFTALTLGTSMFWMYFLFWADSGFKTWGGNNIVRVFWWVGVFACVYAKLLKIEPMKALDFISPCVCISHGLGHYGCIFAGCCHGYPCDWGLFSNEAGYTTFPIQPIEAIAATLIFIYIIHREKKKGFGKGIDGLSYPIMLMLFGYSRFFFEFLRDNDKLFYITKSITWAGKPVFGISQLAVHALVNAVIGTIAYFVIKKKYRPKMVK